METISVVNGALDQERFLAEILKEKTPKMGAFVFFCGIVRAEDEIDALSFDVEENLLKNWFKSWEDLAASKNAKIFMAHTKGECKIGDVCFICACLSPNRKFALKTIDDFIDDLKKNAPIWKFDLKNNQKIFVKTRAVPMQKAGILG